jgi:hypothetical protein
MGNKYGLVGKIIAIGIPIVVLIIFCYCFWFYSRDLCYSCSSCCLCCYLPNNTILKNIVSFLKYEKTNKQIFEENCIICLKNLKIVKIIEGNVETKEKIELIMKKKDNKNILFENEEDKNKNLIEKEEGYNKELIEKEKNGISILNCGHKFHTECIIRWLKLKNNCPICTQILLNEEDNNKIVWKTQIELYPEFRKIKYKHLYTKKFQSDSGDGGSGSGYFDSYGGDCYAGDCGGGCDGGATGGW